MERNNDHSEGSDVGRTWAGWVKRRCEESGHRTLENSLRERSPEQSTTYGRKTTPYWWIQSQRTKDCIQNQSREAADNVARRWERSCWVPDQPRDEDLNHQKKRECSRTSYDQSISEGMQNGAHRFDNVLIESDARWFQLPECETIPFGSKDRAESNQRYDKQVDPWMTLEQRRTESTAKYDFTGVHLRGATKPGLTAEKTRRQPQFGNRDCSMTEPQEIRCRRTIQQRSHWELNTEPPGYQ